MPRRFLSLVPWLCLGTRCSASSACILRFARQSLAGSAFPGGAWERGIALLVALYVGSPALHAQAPRITPPREHFGFNIGDDYCLANYKQLVAYWEKLQAQSD